MRSNVWFALVFTLVLYGCATKRIEVAPPCVALACESSRAPGALFTGQGILVENRVLTAGHIFAQEDLAFPPQEILLNGETVAVSASVHGDPETIRALYHSPRRFIDFVEDWIGLEVVGLSSIACASQWVVGSGYVQYGETLYAVRLEIADSGRHYESVPLTVLNAKADEQIPEGLIFARNHRGQSLASWSGCFVGRFCEKKRQWEFVGILICGKTTDPAIQAILRPPKEALEWLTGASPQLLPEVRN